MFHWIYDFLCLQYLQFTMSQTLVCMDRAAKDCVRLTTLVTVSNMIKQMLYISWQIIIFFLSILFYFHCKGTFDAEALGATIAMFAVMCILIVVMCALVCICMKRYRTCLSFNHYGYESIQEWEAAKEDEDHDLCTK